MILLVASTVNAGVKTYEGTDELKLCMKLSNCPMPRDF